MSPFAGRTALITGAGSGIGAALAGRLRSEGATVLTTDIAGEVDHELDVRDLDAFRALVGQIGVPDLVIANAGISMGGPAHELTREHWDRIIGVNLDGVVNTVLSVYPHMVERGSGQLVLTASVAGLVAAPFVAAYATTKHAVVGLGLGLRSEGALHGVRVNVLCPGAVDTPILDRPPPADLPPTPTAAVTARRYLAVIRQRPIDTDRFARLALRGVARDRGIIAVPASARPLWYLHRLSPTITGRISRSLAERVSRELVIPSADQPPDALSER